MATYKKDQLLGSSDYYKVHEEAKRYTLRDNGFVESKNGSFQYERTLSLHTQNKSIPKLKIVVSKGIDELKLSAVTSNGLKKVDLYKSDQLKEEREFAEGIIKSLVDAKVLEKV
ncbi:hypothetical protein [Alkalibacterium kapii]|uniref:Cysteine desulfurase n=1 Tax=Alkalibacterium kapii TaxID=426704 RepID=A0A511ATF7_9LACT|nr:hypothetical protein [Alkalibacterium kapii]GEK91484.1 cysteine desulfurase [Alkalibacterium kapii]